ncbi:MAG TPA: c-type cytochrome [Cyclobacteriaceae bacterium]
MKKNKAPKDFIIAGIFLLCLVHSCSFKEHQKNMRFKQYYVKGKKLYTVHCQNCHQENGQGLGNLYPPLAKSDYLLRNVRRSACISKYGIEKPIVVNSEAYNQPMPGIEQLTVLEITEILNYVYNAWGNDYGMISPDSVRIALENCNEPY